MSAETEKMTDEEIAKWQEELEELESSAMAGPQMTESEKMRRIKEVASGDFQKSIKEKIEARKRELAQEIANTLDTHKKNRLQQDLTLISGY